MQTDVEMNSSNNMEGNTVQNQNDDRMVKLLEKQLFYSRVLTIMFAVILCMVIGMGVYILKFAGEVQVCVDKVTVLTKETTKKVDSIDVEKINALIDRAGTTMDTVDDMLSVTNQAAVQMTEILSNLEGVSKSLSDVQEKFNNLFNFRF